MKESPLPTRRRDDYCSTARVCCFDALLLLIVCIGLLAHCSIRVAAQVTFDLGTRSWNRMGNIRPASSHRKVQTPPLRTTGDTQSKFLIKKHSTCLNTCEYKQTFYTANNIHRFKIIHFPCPRLNNQRCRKTTCSHCLAFFEKIQKLSDAQGSLKKSKLRRGWILKPNFSQPGKRL